MSSSHQSRDQRARVIFDQACNLDPVRQASFLTQECDNDPELRRQVELLLDADKRMDGFLVEPISVGGLLNGRRSMSANKQDQLKIGETINYYEVIRPLGKGGMGEVYLARDARLDRKVALKILPAEFARDVELLRRFTAEALALASLNHQNIVAIYDFGKYRDFPYIVTEYVNGPTLRERITQAEDGRIKIEEAVKIEEQVVSALAASHKRDVLHRDLKPENIIQSADGPFKLVDYGIAKRGVRQASENSPTESLGVKTMPGTVLGTPEYMSPEQTRGEEIDGRSDIFSSGSVLYKMLTGQVPFKGSWALQVMEAICAQNPKPLKAYLPKVPEELQRIIDKSLEKKPKNRYQSAEEFLDDLRAFQKLGDRRKVTKKVIWSLVGGATAGVMAVKSCDLTHGDPDVVLRLSGSSTVGDDLMPELVEDFMFTKGVTNIERLKNTVNKTVTIQGLFPPDDRLRAIEVVATGSGEGLKDLIDNKCTIAMSSREVTSEEATELRKKSEFSGVVIGRDGVALIVNKDNPISSLNSLQVRKILTGEIKYWEELEVFKSNRGCAREEQCPSRSRPASGPASRPASGPASRPAPRLTPIQIFDRTAEAGTRSFVFSTFNLLHDTQDIHKCSLASPVKSFVDNKDVSREVSKNLGGFGFVAYPFVKRAKIVALSDCGGEGLLPTRETIDAETYLLSRPLYLYFRCTKRSEQRTALHPLAMELIEFCLSEPGQRIVEPTSFVKLGFFLEEVQISPDANVPFNYRRIAQIADRSSLNIRFPRALSELDERAKRDVVRAAKHLQDQRYANRTIWLLGFADVNGPVEANNTLSKNRVGVVENALSHALGGGRFNIKTAWFGSKMPVTQIASKDEQEKNRRVELWLERSRT